MPKKEKKKKLSSAVMTIAVAVAIALAAYALFGNRKQYDILGGWVTDSAGVATGFQCGKQGIAASIENSTKQYNSWELNKGKLILRGKLFTEGRIYDFHDTLLIKELSYSSLTTEHNGKTTTYRKIK